MTGRVHTMLFEWSQAKGFETIHSSLPVPEQRLWYDRLLPRLSLPQGHYDTGSTCYLQYDDVMALLHRWPAKDGHQRDSTRTQALLGPPDLLTFAEAVALRTDVEPAGEGSFPGMPPGWVQASDGEDALRAAVKQCQEGLVFLVAGLLTESAVAGRLAVVAPEQDRRALLWGAQRCLARDEDPPWTFSTAETSVSGTDLPRIVFVPSEASSRGYGGDDLSWIDVTTGKFADPAALREAARIVREVLHPVPASDRHQVPGARSLPPAPPPVPSPPRGSHAQVPKAPASHMRVPKAPVLHASVSPPVQQPLPHPASAPPAAATPLEPERSEGRTGQQAEQQAEPQVEQQVEESEYAMFVLSLSIGSALFVMVLMYLGTL